MLKLLFITAFLFSSACAFACWKVEGSYAVDGETWKINQKLDHDREYSFPMGTFILRMKLRTPEGKSPLLSYKVEEKEGLKLNLVTAGEEEVAVGTSKDIYAKGETGQPNSILTIKLKKI